MSIEAALFERLKAQVALVSNRVYAGTAPQGVAKPYIVYTKASPNRIYSHQGFTGLSRPRMQVSCYGETHGSAKDVANQVISALHSWTGASNVRGVFNAGEQDMHEQDTGLHHVPVDFLIGYKE